jgi:hypothetical protein
MARLVNLYGVFACLLLNSAAIILNWGEPLGVPKIFEMNLYLAG